MDHVVRYCETSDGISIAYTTLGHGFPLVVPPNILNSHLQVELGEYSRMRAFHERLAERLLVVRYDARGTGMSQSDVVEFSAEAGERDLLAVVDRLGLDRFALYDHVSAGTAPAAFAARYADRVACLVWWVGQTIAISPGPLAVPRRWLPSWSPTGTCTATCRAADLRLGRTRGAVPCGADAVGFEPSGTDGCGRTDLLRLEMWTSVPRRRSRSPRSWHTSTVHRGRPVGRARSLRASRRRTSSPSQAIRRRRIQSVMTTRC